MAYRYKTIKVDGKTKLLHRHVMEQHLGRALARHEQVHHRNGDTHDNRLDNLEVLTAKEHQGHHKQKHATTKRCVACGAEFTPAPTKRKRAVACSKPCAYKAMWATRRGCPPIAAAIVRANCGLRERVERAA